MYYDEWLVGEVWVMLKFVVVVNVVVCAEVSAAMILRIVGDAFFGGR